MRHAARQLPSWLIFDVRQKMRPGIKLMADYHSWPLWHYGGSEVGNIDPRSLGLSTALQAGLMRWAEDYDSHLDLDDPASIRWTEEERAAFDLEGRRLCTALALELTARFEVFFFDQRAASCIPVADLFVSLKRPNKAPEPTPGAVTPRATEGASK